MTLSSATPEPLATNAGSAARSTASRGPIRARLAADVAAFLEGGGRIEEVPRDFRADPPRRPQSTYGRGSL